MSDDQSSIPTQPVPIPPEPEGHGVSPAMAAAMLGAMRSASGGGWQPPTPEELQRSFPQYEIRGILGRGGMGAVYKGWQTNLDRFVAIKILPPGVDDGGMNFADRFKQEAKAMAKFHHPGIVAVYDAGQTPEGLLYFIMECIEGTDVHQLVAASGKLPPEQALGIADRVCEALAYAHGHGVIHRDIKPSNIMIENDGTVKVADFGLAKLSTHQSAMLTMTNVTMGTPDFMAPESFQGTAHVDHRADLYAVGVMLYQMLTGKVPRGRFDPPSRAVPGLDKRLDRLVDKALQTDRDARYSTAIEMRAEIEPLLARATGRPGAVGGGASASRKKPVLLALAATVAVAAVAALVHFAPWKESGTGVPPVKTASTTGVPPVPLSADGSAAGPDFGKSSYTKDAPFVNSLGMKFVPVAILGGASGGQRVLFSVWDTRVQDYGVFAKETRREWPKADFEQGPTHPAVNVSWEDAQLFCQWLTGREQAEGRLPAGWSYRLPSDHEWSCAVDLGAREDPAKLPGDKNGKIADAFPWGSPWPPPDNAGNYASEELQPLLAAGKFTSVKGVITGYHDGYATTSPVGSYAANRFGLYDMGGNVQQWCEDWLDQDQKNRVLRGTSYLDLVRYALLSSSRYQNIPTSRNINYGFRCVLEPASSPAPAAKVASGARPPGALLPPDTERNAPGGRVPPELPPVLANASKAKPFVNSLGMKFVPVPIVSGPTAGQRVLFGVWDVRVQDYAAYAVANPKADGGWRTNQKDGVPVGRELDHPVVGVNWEDAQAFCKWLTEKETAEGRLPKGVKYRLPGDEEWSWAAGLPPELGTTPAEKSGKNSVDFPWGKEYPPRGKVGNYADDTFHAKFPPKKNEKANSMEDTWIEGYNDGYATTSPVGSFPANAYGLYDMGGNVYQWCEDWFDASHKDRVLRGATWASSGRGYLLSSYRYPSLPSARRNSGGFRCVLGVSAPPAAPAAKAP